VYSCLAPAQDECECGGRIAERCGLAAVRVLMLTQR